MQTSKVGVVVPTIREECIKRFLSEWNEEFERNNCTVYVVEDNEDETFDLPAYKYVKHFAHRNIEDALGKNAWIIPKKTDCVRSFGYWQAYLDGMDYIITLDDDCYPLTEERGLTKYKKVQPQGSIAQHVLNLTNHNVTDDAWVSTIEEMRPRGIPYMTRFRALPIVLSHGLWLNNPDLDAITQLSAKQVQYGLIQRIIPIGKYYPMCGMNIAFIKELTPIMYFLLMGRDYSYDRFGDIWAGIFSKRIIDHLGKGVISGTPIIWHERASNPWDNLHKEHIGYEMNEGLWSLVDGIRFTETTYKGCYIHLIQELRKLLGAKSDYWKLTTNAMNIWVDLF